jgi:Cu/Ag efflux protein CusF
MRKHLLFALAATAALVSLAAPAAHAEEWTNGEVRKIDAANAKITLKHEYIKVIDMPPMAMVFPLADARAARWPEARRCRAFRRRRASRQDADYPD